MTRVSRFTGMLLLLGSLNAGLSTGLTAAELIMIEQDHCVYCEKFNREIATAYPKTEEGKRAPLRRIDLAETWPADLANIKSEPFTPTFILVENGQEYARLRGYPGDEYFWFLLEEMLEKLDTGNSEGQETLSR